MSKRTCCVDGCESPVLARDRCSKHYARFTRHGSDEKPKRPVRLCSIEGCEKKHDANGLCAMHRMRLVTTGTTDDPTPWPTVCQVEGCDGQHFALGRCQKHYNRFRRWGTDDLRGHKTTPLADRLWRKVDKTGPGECWIWTGSTDSRGYGQIQAGTWNNPVVRRTHIVAYELLVGLVPEGLELDHTCHSRLTTCHAGPDCPHRRCCNPAHLEPVTHAENVRRSWPARNAQSKGGGDASL